MLQKESISFEQAVNKVIWVTSGAPSNSNEKHVVESILEQPEKTRKENLSLLKTVDLLVEFGFNRENLTSFVERSLKNLEVDALDLLQLHCPPTMFP